MTIDAVALSAIRKETQVLARGGRVQKIIPTGPLSLVLEIYNPVLRQRVQLLFSAEAQTARFYIQRQKANQQPGEPSPFLLLLRKYIRSGILNSIEQVPFERIIILSISKKFPSGKRPYFGRTGPASTGLPIADLLEVENLEEEEPVLEENFELYESKLVIEIMGRHSNIMLLGEDGIIIDAIKRVPPSKNRFRLILPHQEYISPPAQKKQNILLTSLVEFEELMRAKQTEKSGAFLSQALVEIFGGVSPQLAREMVYRAAGKPEILGSGIFTGPTLGEIQDWKGVYQEGLLLLDPLINLANKTEEEENKGAWLVRNEEGKGLAFAPYELWSLINRGNRLEKVQSLSHAAEQFYNQAESKGGYSLRKQEIGGVIAGHQEIVRRRAAAMAGAIKKAEGAEELKRKGEAIYAHLYELHSGQTLLETDGLKITLDPDLSPSENAQAYFKDYDKARQALAGVPELLAEANLELAYIEEMVTQLNLAETFEEVINLQRELTEAGFGGRELDKGKKVSKKEGKPGRAKRRKLPQTPTFTSPDGLTIYVGKSAQHNEYVTFELGEKGDLWLHARGMPGSHVIIKTRGSKVPEKTLEFAASLAAYYSKGQTSNGVEVTFAFQRFVRKVKGQHPGLVTYLNDQSIRVKPRKPD